jgi:8-oxo-dGTP pyrophosphatase MutT (NUDIX family)
VTRCTYVLNEEQIWPNGSRCIPLIRRFDIESLKQRLNPTSSIEGSKSNVPIAAVAIIIDVHRDSDSILLMRRQERVGDPWSGQIAFPGGHKSPSDGTLLDTAIREASEEVGIELRRHVTLGVLQLVYSQTRRVLVAPFVFQLKSDVAVRVNDEVAETGSTPFGKDSRQLSLALFNQPPSDSTHADSTVPPGGTATVSNSLSPSARTVRTRSRYPQQEKR